MVRKAGLFLSFVFLALFGTGQVAVANYTITLTPTAVTKLESAGNATFTVAIGNLPDSGDVVSVPYATFDGTATAPGDYAPNSGMLTFNSGSPLSQNIVIPIADNLIIDGTRDFTLSIDSPSITTSVGSTVSISGTSSATVTIVDDDYIVSTLSDISVNEDDGNAHLTVTLDRAVATGDSVSFSYSSADIEALAGSDYTAVSGTLTIPAGSSSGTINIPINNDTKVECAETFSVTIAPTSASVSVVDDTAIVTINIDDTYKINISPDQSVDVGTGVAKVSVIVTPALASGDLFTVAYDTADGTAEHDSDYTAQSGILSFSHGSTNPLTISVPILNDGVQHGAETFTFKLGSITAGTPTCSDAIVFLDSSTQITINDNDFKITAGVTQNLTEHGGSMVFTVVLNRDPVGSEVVTVNYMTVDGTAIAGSDFTAKSGTLTIDATDTAGDKVIPSVPILNDGVKEPAEYFTMKLSGASVNTLITDATATGNITDDDYAVTAFDDIVVAESDGNAILTVTLDYPVAASDNVSFSYSSANGTASAGSDYTAVSGTLTIPTGSSSGTISIPITNDALIELAETFTVAITPTSGNVVVTGASTPNNSATVTINVDEQYNVSIDDQSVQEADTNMTFTVSISPPLQLEDNGLVINLATVDGSATAPADYTAIVGGTITFATGETTKTQVVTIKEDTIDEGVSENFNLNLTGASIPSIVTFSDASGLGTILDTDYAITPTWNQGGNVTMESPVGTAIPIISGNGVGIANNTPAKFTVTATYRIHSVLIDGVAPGSLSYITPVLTDDKNHTYTFGATTPQGAHTIAVLFDHQIDMAATGLGTVSHTTGIGQIVYNGGTELVLADHGENESFEIYADSGQCVTDLLIDGSSVGAFYSANHNWEISHPYTFNNVTDDHTLNAEFGTAEIIVTINSDDGATGTVDDAKIQTDAIWYAYATDASYNPLTPQAPFKSGTHGESFTLPTDASCDVQYVLIQFLAVDGWTKPNDIKLNLNTAFKNQEIEGLYDRDYHILTIVATHGRVTITDPSDNPVGSPYVGTNRYIFPADTVIKLTAVSDLSWNFQIWQGDASGTVSPVTITMNSDKTVEPVFVQDCQDLDKDGYTTSDYSGSGCKPSAKIDCNDGNALIHPDVTDICDDGIDQDCSGADLVCSGNDKDDDGDGYTENQGDCDDTNINIRPGLYDDPATAADEDCYDGAKLVGSEVTCSQPSDIPVTAARKPAPPLIMFLLDDSGSMDWEFMTSESNQLFNNDYYVYAVNDIESNYNYSYYYALDNSGRKKWLGQWSGYNRIFYNPATVYDPWPRWEEVIGAGNVRPHEKQYAGTGTFPETAYFANLTHADMDRPRLNSYDSSSTINAMYHPGDANSNHARYEMDLNAEFVQVKTGVGAGQQIMVTRDSSSTGDSTLADAIGLSTNANLELSVGHTYAWYNEWYNAATRPEIIFDNLDGNTVYSETGTWKNSQGDTDYEWGAHSWEENDRYADASGLSASWKLNLTAIQAGDYYAYAWVDETSTRDGKALYTLFSYDQGTGDLISQNVRKDQSPTNTSSGWHMPATGARWIRLNDNPIHLIGQSSTTLSIPNAHYFTWYDANEDGNYWDDTNGDGVKDVGEAEDPGEKYLVISRGSGYAKGNYTLEYYLFNDINGNDAIEDGELIPKTGAAVPTEVIPVKHDSFGTKITDTAELAYVVRQDFADWFSFYRRRMLTAKAAVGLTVVDMTQLKLGLHTINRSYTEPLILMNQVDSGEKLKFLKTLYNIRPTGSTYLRRGLDDVGRYFQEGDSIKIGNKTYKDCDDSNDFDPHCYNLKTSTGLNPGTCSGDRSVFYDADKDVDADTCDDAGGECQRAYVIAMTDGYYNGGYSSGRIGGADNNSTYLFMRDSADNSLADLAYYYYNTDLDTTLANKVPSKGFDDGSNQKLVTYMVSFGVFGYFDPGMFPDCLPACDTPGRDGCPKLLDIGIKNWTDSGDKAIFSGAAPFNNVCPNWHDDIYQEKPQAIDDLFHASVNGRGKFYNAADPGELVESLKNIKQLIDNVTGTAASVSVNSRKIEDDTLLFQTTYDSSDWSGDVLAKCLDSSGNVASCLRASCEAGCNTTYDTCVSLCNTTNYADCEPLCVSNLISCHTNTCSGYLTCDETKNACDTTCAGDTACLNDCSTAESTCSNDPPEVKWSAKKQLATVTYDNRQIISSIPSATGTAGVAGVPFRWANLTAPMKAYLNNQADMLNYLRGSSQYERRNDTGSVHNYRSRPNTVLGDFINSEPYHYEDTTLGIDWVVVGGNDGMLHIFNGLTGKELFAYVPNAVFDHLSDLAAEGYLDGHKFYVDGYLEIKKIGSKLILISGLGKGGKGYFALDLTAAANNINNIEAHAAEIVLWEYTDLTRPLYKDNLGYSFSRPWIGPTNDPSVDWLFVFGNGYDSTNKSAVLFTVGLNGNGEIQWTRAIDTNTGGASPDCNGLSSPAVLYPQGDGVDDYLYAGDLLGNMWKFNLTDTNKFNWNIYFTNGVTRQPLFTAKSNAGYRQPITMQPDVTTSCSAGVSGYLVAFGTGRLLDPNEDTQDMSVQTAYGIWDWSAAWEDEGVAPEGTYLGTFQQESSPPTTACTNSCTSARGDETTSGSCIYECVGYSECIDECEQTYDSCTNNCSAVRNLSNMSSILGTASAKYVALLRQTQVWGGGVNYKSDGSISEQQYGATNAADYDEITRVMSANEIDWLLPEDKAEFVSDISKTIKHVGWYFDLPANGERIIRDMAILNHKLIYTTSLPSDSPCESGGKSNFFAVDVCTGGRVLTPFYDINGDGIIDSKDYINIGTAADPIYVAPSSIQVEELAPSPTPVEVVNGQDKLYFPEDGDTGGTAITAWGKALQYWRELEWK